jgi:hypothetical protein
MKRRFAIEKDLQQHLRAAVREETWTEEEIALLGQLPDAKNGSPGRLTLMI